LRRCGTTKLPILDENRRRALEEPSPELTAQPQRCEATVDDEKDKRREDATDYRDIRPNHGVLDGIRDEEDHHEVEYRHLPEFALCP